MSVKTFWPDGLARYLSRLKARSGSLEPLKTHQPSDSTLVVRLPVLGCLGSWAISYSPSASPLLKSGTHQMPSIVMATLRSRKGWLLLGGGGGVATLCV